MKTGHLKMELINFIRNNMDNSNDELIKFADNKNDDDGQSQSQEQSTQQSNDDYEAFNNNSDYYTNSHNLNIRNMDLIDNNNRRQQLITEQRKEVKNDDERKSNNFSKSTMLKSKRQDSEHSNLKTAAAAATSTSTTTSIIFNSIDLCTKENQLITLITKIRNDIKYIHQGVLASTEKLKSKQLRLIGNIITILVIFRFRYMQTITNLYLCNLAITDLISLMFSLPLELYTLWHQYPWQLGSVMCSLKTLILEGTANASVLTLVAFTVERFLAICGSSKHQTLQPTTQTLFNFKSILHIKRLVYRNILLIWLISISGAIPLVLLTRVNYLETTNHQKQKLIKQSAWCGLAYNVPDKRWELIMLSSTIIFFLIPLLIISCLYYKIAKKLKKTIKLDYNFNLQQSSLSNDYYGQQQQQQLNDHLQSRKIIQSRRIVIRMLVVIVIVFTFCWSPFHAQRLLFLYVTLYSSWNMFLRQINGILFLSAGCLYYLNSSLNPLITFWSYSGGAGT
ncbi:neuromedin U receptor [Dermatophagoides pteronyssinus]|uniref:Neuromedin U receptor n=1 Tax=Dermatophagoides pteronyssinus TaxID=6956 RepID=A0ABQ8IRD0_DERPT|nr:neuromedin U receptor [Dermatophagoides pteronyssinus]